MSQKDAFIAELKYEAVNTRRMLERVPGDKFAWKPHDKSMTIGRLSSHIAEIPVWVNRTLEADSFNFAGLPLVRNTYESTEALLRVFDDMQTAALAALSNATDDALNQQYTLLRGEQVVYEMPRKVLIRNFTFNHIIHHRGQLSVFLRLLDIPVPGMYGPSADEKG